MLDLAILIIAIMAFVACEYALLRMYAMLFVDWHKRTQEMLCQIINKQDEGWVAVELLKCLLVEVNYLNREINGEPNVGENNPYYPKELNPCPKCGNKSIRFFKDVDNVYYSKCEMCGNVIQSIIPAAAVQYWNLQTDIAELDKKRNEPCPSCSPCECCEDLCEECQ